VARKSRKDCLDDIANASGRPRMEVEDAIDEIFNRAEGYEHDGMPRDDAYDRARDEFLKQSAEQDMLRRRGAILDMRKEIAFHRFMASTVAAIKKLSPRHAKTAYRLAIEAKTVGVNLPFLKNRLSVDSQYVALKRQLLGGFAADLERAGLMKIFATKVIEDKWTDELFELNREKFGKPGLTNDKQALAIAKIVRKWQRQSMAMLNREGAWVRSYSGFITRSSHDPDKIGKAGMEKWVNRTYDRIDLKRTFGSADKQAALDALRKMWPHLRSGDHFDYGKPIEEPLYPNVAKRASATRELHFKSGKDWREYNDAFGVSNPTHTAVQALSTAARRTALMKEFGTRPAEMFDRALDFARAAINEEDAGRISRLSAMDATDKAARPADYDDKLAALKAEIDKAPDQLSDFNKWEQPLRNRFAQIDGSSMKPVNRTQAEVLSNWMAVQRMAKLGRVALTHFASLPTKSLEARYWGIPFAERFSSLFRGLTSGPEGSAKREALDATLVAFENRLGHMMAMYDVADAPSGLIGKMEGIFFKLTGVSSVIDNQRGDAEAMFASHIGAKRGQAWADIGRKEQRVLGGFGIGEAEWKALHGVEWSKAGDRTYLFPNDALKLSDEQVAAYINEARPPGTGLMNGPEDIDKIRQDLALQLATAYTDRAAYAIPMPGARVRAMLFGKNFQPGTAMNTALRLLYQFKIWPVDMITRAWEREIYGTIGDGKYDRMAGLAEAAVAAIIFGVASEGVRDLVQGKDALAKLRDHPIAAIVEGAQRSGFGSLVGDFLLGQYDRHGFSAVASLAGPTYAQIDTLMGIMHGDGDSFLGAMYDGITGGEGEHKGQHPWRSRATELAKFTRDNTPFMNLWLTSWATNALIWNRFQEWINPGYLQRSEARQKQMSGTSFLFGPAKIDRMITGR
jgi:hypothetical protein